MINEVRQTVVSNFLEFARKAFKRMADEELEERFISVFKHQLEDLSLKDKKFLAADTEDVPLQISTSEELTPEAQEGLKKCCRKFWKSKIRSSFLTSTRVCCAALNFP